MTKKFRCRLGLHKFREIARRYKHSNIVICEECQLCGHRQFWAGIMLVNPELLEELKKELGEK